MLGYDWPRFHAAVNDLPAALLFVTVLFDLGAWVTKRDSLKSAAVWTLWAGVIGGWVAVLAGLQAEDVVEHGGDPLRSGVENDGESTRVGPEVGAGGDRGAGGEQQTNAECGVRSAE